MISHSVRNLSNRVRFFLPLLEFVGGEAAGWDRDK